MSQTKYKIPCKCGKLAPVLTNGLCKPCYAMTQVKHTPGKWEFGYGLRGDNTIFHKVTANFDMENEIEICDTFGPDSEANARLIASAPELLEACKTALDCFRNMYDTIGAGEQIENIMKNEDFWPLAQLRVAIAKTERSEV